MFNEIFFWEIDILGEFITLVRKYYCGFLREFIVLFVERGKIRRVLRLGFGILLERKC